MTKETESTRPSWVRVAVVALISGAFALGAAIALASNPQANSDDGTEDGIRDSVLVNGIPTPIASDQTDEEAEALEGSPLWEFPQEFLDLVPGG